MRSKPPATRGRPRAIESRRAITLILIGAFALSLLGVDWSEGVFRPRGLIAIVETLGALFRPDLSPELLRKAAAAGGRRWSMPSRADGRPAHRVRVGVIASGSIARSRWGPSQIGAARAVLAFFRPT